MVFRSQRYTIDPGDSIWHAFSFFCSSNNQMSQRRISCEPWLRLQRAHLGNLCWNFDEHVQGLYQRRAVEDPNLRFLHVLFRDCQVSGVVQLAINLVILVLTLLIFVWTSSSSVGGYLPRKLSNKIFSSSSLGSVFSASEGSTLTFSTAAAGFLRTGDAMAIEEDATEPMLCHCRGRCRP